jgi:hypothetical protein
MTKRPASFSVLAKLAVLSLGMAGTASTAESDLRDAFLRGEGGEASKLIARVSVMLVQSSGAREVRVDHPFRSGDRFRFAVTSNRRGWLYVFHRSSSGRLEQLWPAKAAGFPQQQEVKAGQSYLIPPSPATFDFDYEAGDEEFTIAIRSQDTPPNVLVMDATGLTRATPASGAPPSKKTTANIVIRGDPFDGGSSRGVTLDPGTDDPDPHLYFSAASGDDGTKAIIRFTLRHAK